MNILAGMTKTQYPSSPHCKVIHVTRQDAVYIMRLPACPYDMYAIYHAWDFDIGRKIKSRNQRCRTIV